MSYLGTYHIDDYVGIPAATHRFSSGAAYAPTSLTYSIYEEANATGIDEDVDMTVASPFDAITGCYWVRRQLTAAAGFEAGKNYLVIVKATVDSVAAIQMHTFQIETASVAQTGDAYAVVAHADYGNAKLVRSTTPANTLTVDTDHRAYADLRAILATALTETAGQIAAAFKKFFDVATPTGTVDSLPDAAPGANGGLPTVNASNYIAGIAGTKNTLDSLNDAPAVSAADVKTALEANGSKLDHLWEMTEDDGGVRRLTANALEEGPSVSAQEVRDALKLAPTAGDPAAGSIDDHLDDLQTDVTTLLARVTASLFSGITSLKSWLGALAGKTADTATRAEINATNAGATYNETTDSQEALADALTVVDDYLDTEIAAIKAKTDTIGSVSVTVTSPVATDGAITVTRGDDYLNVDGRAIGFTLTGFPSITGGTVALKIKYPGSAVVSYAGVVTSATACYVELTDTQTAALLPNRSYNYDLEVTLANGSVITPQQGHLVVTADVR